MVLRSYFDGGNKADSAQYPVVSLAVTSATVNEWAPFEHQWRMVLNRHRVKYLHTTDCISRQGIYEGWTEIKAEKLLKDCAKVAARHFIRMTTDSDPGKFGIYCFVVSIVLADFIEHCKNSLDAVKDANEGLFRQAIGDTLLWSTEPFASCEQIHCIFDRGEPFYGYLVNVLESKRASKDAWLLKKIEDRTESNSQELPPLQLADLFAWVENHKHDPWNPPWKKKILGLPYQWQLLDKTNLSQINHSHQQAWKAWKVPRRAATK